MNNVKVLFDSSVITYGKPLRWEVVEFITKHKNNQEFKFKYYLPEVVKNEYIKNIYNKFTDYEAGYISNQKNIKALLNINLPKKQTTKKTVVKRIEYYLDKYKFEVIKTPYNKVNLKQVLDKAVWYKPPFKQITNEKGFKDYIVALTFKNFVGKNKKDNIAIICQDGDLRKYTEDIFKKSKKVNVYDSVASFTNKIALELAKISQNKQMKLLAQAQETINKIIEKDSIVSKIIDSKFNIFDNPRSTGLSGLMDTGWEKTKDQFSYSVDKVELKERVDDTLNWENKINIYKRYSKKDDFPFIFTKTQDGNENRKYARFEFTFNLKWKSKIDKNENLIEPKIISDELVKILRFEELSNFVKANINPVQEGDYYNDGTRNISNLSDYFNER